MYNYPLGLRDSMMNDAERKALLTMLASIEHSLRVISEAVKAAQEAANGD